MLVWYDMTEDGLAIDFDVGVLRVVGTILGLLGHVPGLSYISWHHSGNRGNFPSSDLRQRCRVKRHGDPPAAKRELGVDQHRLLCPF